MVACLGGAEAPAISGVCSAAASYAGGGSKGILVSDMVIQGVVVECD